MPDSPYSNWFAKFRQSAEYETLKKGPVAYFCAEYALLSGLPTYAGGLGILAGDHVRETAAQEFPMVAVGLFYKKAQSIFSLEENYKQDKLKILTNEKGERLIVTLPFEGRMVHAQAWQWGTEGKKVYFLDTDIEKNNPEDREITKELYNEDRDIRLKQEILLGIGGFRLLAQLGYHTSVYHLNEGHSAFLALELVRHEMEHQKVGFHKACEFAKKHIIFTNHTLVPAGQEQFSAQRVAELIEHCSYEICLNSSEIVKLGALEDNPEIFSMTHMSFRLSTKSNSVSKLHLGKAKELWPEHAEKMENITNGISIAKWDKIGDTPTEKIWGKHQENKKKLLGLVKEKTGEIWGEKDLVFVWARRMVSYKQPLLLLDNVEQLIEIAKNSPLPIRIIFSGPTSESENPFAEEIKKMAEGKLKGLITFVPNYSMEIAEILTAGADVWLNTPLAGNEACGTSGMKAGLNGALNLSTKDGWVGEVSDETIGWVVSDCQSGEEMRMIMEKEIIPLYATHLKNPENSEWLARMIGIRNLILQNFSTERALKEYIEKLYLPTLTQKHMHKVT